MGIEMSRLDDIDARMQEIFEERLHRVEARVEHMAPSTLAHPGVPSRLVSAEELAAREVWGSEAVPEARALTAERDRLTSQSDDAEERLAEIFEEAGVRNLAELRKATARFMREEEWPSDDAELPTLLREAEALSKSGGFGGGAVTKSWNHWLGITDPRDLLSALALRAPQEVICRVLCDVVEYVLPYAENQPSASAAWSITRQWCRGEATTQEVQKAARAARDAADLLDEGFADYFAVFAAYFCADVAGEGDVVDELKGAFVGPANAVASNAAYARAVDAVDSYRALDTADGLRAAYSELSSLVRARVPYDPNENEYRLVADTVVCARSLRFQSPAVQVAWDSAEEGSLRPDEESFEGRRKKAPEYVRPAAQAHPALNHALLSEAGVYLMEFGDNQVVLDEGLNELDRAVSDGVDTEYLVAAAKIFARMVFAQTAGLVLDRESGDAVVSLQGGKSICIVDMSLGQVTGGDLEADEPEAQRAATLVQDLLVKQDELLEAHGEGSGAAFGGRIPTVKTYGHWLSPSGDWRPTQNHEDTAEKILKMLGISLDDEWGATLQLQNMGYARIVTTGCIFSFSISLPLTDEQVTDCARYCREHELVDVVVEAGVSGKHFKHENWARIRAWADKALADWKEKFGDYEVPEEHHSFGAGGTPPHLVLMRTEGTGTAWRLHFDDKSQGLWEDGDWVEIPSDSAHPAFLTAYTRNLVALAAQNKGLTRIVPTRANEVLLADEYAKALDEAGGMAPGSYTSSPAPAPRIEEKKRGKTAETCSSQDPAFKWLRLDVCVKRTTKDPLPQGIRGADDVSKYMHSTFGKELREGIERGFILVVDTKIQPLALAVISTGGRAMTVVEMPEVLRPVLLLPGAAGFFFVHNHPSEGLAPSSDDHELTKRMVIAAETMKIKLFDHLILTRDPSQFYSFVASGTMPRA